MGRVTGAYGVRGWINVQPYTGVPEALIAYRTWWLTEGRGDKATPYRVLEARVHSDRVIAMLDGIASREEAARIRGASVCVARAELPDVADDEVYVADLAGLDVVNRNGERLGTVAEVQEFGAHPVLRVTSEGGSDRLIPFVAAYVLGVDLEAGRIDVDWEADY